MRLFRLTNKTKLQFEWKIDTQANNRLLSNYSKHGIGAQYNRMVLAAMPFRYKIYFLRYSSLNFAPAFQNISFADISGLRV